LAGLVALTFSTTAIPPESAPFTEDEATFGWDAHHHATDAVSKAIKKITNAFISDLMLPDSVVLAITKWIIVNLPSSAAALAPRLPWRMPGSPLERKRSDSVAWAF
jgi:hypothetical protein